MSLTLPTGLSVRDLTPGLLAGLAISGNIEAEGSESESVTTYDEETIATVMQSVGEGTSAFRLDRDGVEVAGGVARTAFQAEIADVLPFPINLTTGQTDSVIRFPLVARTSPQDVRLGLRIEDLTVDDTIWDSFDPSRALDRSPSDIELDLGGRMIWELIALNLQELEQLQYAETTPITPLSVSINAVKLSALGAMLDAVGAFSFQGEGAASQRDMPWPEGAAEITATGLNRALDQLEAAGLMPRDQVGMTRMMMGMFGRVTEDDTLQTSIETNAEGHVIVNGQRMR